MDTIRTMNTFFLEFIKHPDTVGSVCPSSTALSERLLDGISTDGDGLVIDLGAGSGPVSACMLRRGIPTKRILAIEALEDFAAPFAERCPGVRLLIGDARNLKSILDSVAPGQKISAVVSSLPFRALGPQTTEDIMREIHRVLRERGGVFIQYTYAWWLRYPLREHGFDPQRASVVWKNLPPARVEAYGPADGLIPAGRAARNEPGWKALRLAGTATEKAGSLMLRVSLASISLCIVCCSYTMRALARITGMG